MDPLDPVAALQRLGTVADGTTLRGLCGESRLRIAVSEGRIVHQGRNSYACLARTTLARQPVVSVASRPT